MTASTLAMLWSMVLLAAALLTVPGSARSRSRLIRPGQEPPGPRAPEGLWRSRPGRVRRAGARLDSAAEPLALAGAWDLLAACLRAGLPVAVAVRAVAEGLDLPAGIALRRTADLLALGADPEQAWQPAVDCTSTARLARAARRSGRSGAALAESLARMATTERAEAREQSEARAQRAAVLIAGPLGLCFLPAFLALGVIPVVIGLAVGLVQQW